MELTHVTNITELTCFLKQDYANNLFYELDDLKLSRMYQKMGFGEVGTWVVATRNDLV